MERFDALNKLVSLKSGAGFPIQGYVTSAHPSPDHLRSALALHAMAIIEEARIEIKCVRATSQ